MLLSPYADLSPPGLTNRYQQLHLSPPFDADRLTRACLHCHREPLTAYHQTLSGLDLARLRRELASQSSLMEDQPLALEAMFSPACQFLTREPYSEGEAGLPLEQLLRFQGRPGQRLDLEQMPCLPASARHRAALCPAGARVLLLGDDDLVSLFLPQAIVLEKDPDLIDFLRSRGVEVEACDFFDGLPAAHQGRYSLVLSDPPWEARGMHAFLDCARQALAPGGRLLLSTHYAFLQAPLDFQRYGLRLVRAYPAFNRYPMPAGMAESHLFHAARMGLDPDLGEIVFFPPFVYSDLLALTNT